MTISPETGLNTLSRARDLIGGIRSTVQRTCIGTPTYNIYQTNQKNLVYMDSLCLSTLVDALIDAAHLFGYRERQTGKPVSPKRMLAAYEAYTFISGTGLEMVIKCYNMALNADNLRSKFEDLWRQS